MNTTFAFLPHSHYPIQLQSTPFPFNYTLTPNLDDRNKQNATTRKRSGEQEGEAAVRECRDMDDDYRIQ
jgi:hypothetical protein